ncbi:MAG: carboxypeptidase regulatory-like domain-containing protein [Myxococcales bacterium]|nr:carboxypeptidase regulatory-like domain-containing protein [Myxococcales bacterium]
MTPPTPALRRWWWLAAAIAVVALVVLWPRGGGHGRTGQKATASGQPGSRLPFTIGPDGWRAHGRRLGPIKLAPPASGLIRVTGTVRDRLSHKPVPDVEVVFADGATEASVVADVAGRYSIDLPTGMYRPFVRGDGVMSAAPPVRERLPARPRPEQVAATRLELAAALDLQASTDGVDLEVERSGKVRGRVVDGSGRPIAGAIVRAFATDDFGTARPVLGTDVAETDAAGGFELEVAATTYRLDAFHDRFGGVSAYTIVSVTAGETADAEITMASGCVISGRVVRRDGRPVGDGALERGVDSTDADGTYFPDGEFSADGAFVWSTSDELTLYLRAWPWKSAPSNARRFECRDGQRYQDVVFEVPTAAPDMSGRVLTADGRPVPFAFVDVGGESEGTMNQQERADADGNWAVFALPSGQYRISATAEGVGAVVIHASSPSQGVDLHMSGTGTLVGRVLGVSDGAVVLTARGCSLGDDVVAIDYRRVVSIIGGSYHLDGVPACHLMVQVSHAGREVIMDADVQVGQTTTLDLDLPDDKPVLVRGVVRDPDRRPVAGAIVITSGSTAPATAETDADGRFTLEARAGDTLVVTGGGGYTSALLERHGSSTVDLELTLESSIDGDEPSFDDE